MRAKLNSLRAFATLPSALRNQEWGRGVPSSLHPSSFAVRTAAPDPASPVRSSRTKTKPGQDAGSLNGSAKHPRTRELGRKISSYVTTPEREQRRCARLLTEDAARRRFRTRLSTLRVRLASVGPSVARAQAATLGAAKRKAEDVATRSVSAADRGARGVESRVLLAARAESGSTDWTQAACQGQINIVLDGRVDTVHKSIRTTFATVPDAPISKFTLSLDGGNKGLLQNNTNLCKHTLHVTADISGQNGKTANQSPELQTPCKRKSKRHKRHGAGPKRHMHRARKVQ
jgi:hypothetical protein